MTDAQLSAELNRLYWDSDESVGDIADRLDLSRRALYDILEPEAAGAVCPECGGDLVFRNRTARDLGEAECLDCDQEVELDEAAEPDEDEGDPTVEQEERAAPPSPVGQPYELRSGPLLAIALVGGIALGAVVIYLNRSS